MGSNWAQCTHPLCLQKSDIVLIFFFRLSLLEGTMNWHFPFFILTTVTLYSVHSQFNSLSLEELGSNTGIQVFNQIIKSRPHENVVVSPHGIASILGMLQLGADGKTKKQLSTVMRYNVNGVCVCSPSSVRPCPQSCRRRVIIAWSLPNQRSRAAKRCHTMPSGS